MLAFYNLVFIPLQGGFNFGFNPAHIVMEVITLIFYFIDIVYLIKCHQKIKQRLVNLQLKDHTGEKHSWRSIEDEKKDLKKAKLHMF